MAAIFEPTSAAFASQGAWPRSWGWALTSTQELTGRETSTWAPPCSASRRAKSGREGAIIDFAELGQFIDLPAKNYSAGMQLRLGFAIALEVRPDIFLIDKVLSAGDEHFRRKCLQAAQREPVLGAPSWSLTQPHLHREPCERAALVLNGRVAALGPAREVVSAYQELVTGAEGEPVIASGLP